MTYTLMDLVRMHVTGLDLDMPSIELAVCLVGYVNEQEGS